jgi:hypothetical protein
MWFIVRTSLLHKVRRQDLSPHKVTKFSASLCIRTLRPYYKQYLLFFKET